MCHTWATSWGPAGLCGDTEDVTGCCKGPMWAAHVIQLPKVQKLKKIFKTQNVRVHNLKTFSKYTIIKTCHNPKFKQSFKSKILFHFQGPLSRNVHCPQFFYKFKVQFSKSTIFKKLQSSQFKKSFQVHNLKNMFKIYN